MGREAALWGAGGPHRRSVEDHGLRSGPGNGVPFSRPKAAYWRSVEAILGHEVALFGAYDIILNNTIFGKKYGKKSTECYITYYITYITII